MVKLLNLTQDLRQPPFASAVILELRRALNSSQYYIQALYKNNTPSEPISYTPMSINGQCFFAVLFLCISISINLTSLLSRAGCDMLCPYEKFVQLTDSMVVTDVLAECQSKGL